METDQLELHVVEVGIAAIDTVEIAVEGIGCFRVVRLGIYRCCNRTDFFPVGQILHACPTLDKLKPSPRCGTVNQIAANALGYIFEIVAADDIGFVKDIAENHRNRRRRLGDERVVMKFANQLYGYLFGEFA